jgi:CheY-like chemotaxis protein
MAAATNSLPGSGGGLLKESVILLVEDRQDDITIIARAFAEAKLDNPVRVVTDGEKAMQYLQGEGDYADRARNPLPQLILLDLKLPKVDGFEFLKWLRQQPEYGHIIVLVLTVSAEVRDVHRAYDLGANSFMVKPDDFRNVTEMVRSLRDYWLLGNKAPTVRSMAEGDAGPRATK